MTGWTCPSCRRCYAPSVTMCLYCQPTLPVIVPQYVPSGTADPRPPLPKVWCGPGNPLTYDTTSNPPLVSW